MFNHPKVITIQVVMSLKFLLPVFPLAYIAVPCLTGCVTQVTSTNELSPGMSPSEVKSVLGAPSQTQFVGNKWVWKYSLHEPWKGFIPYYLVFTKDDPTLEGWYADQDEYYRQQKLWIDAAPRQHNINLKIKE